MSENFDVIPVNCDSTMAITTPDSLRSYAQQIVVRFPDFGEGQPLVAKVKRVSMLALAKTGKIPNALLNSATEIFQGGARKQDAKGNPLVDMYDLCRIMAECCLASPTLAEIEEAGLELTDEQLVAIFNYTQKGVKALTPFREKSENHEHLRDVEHVQGPTE